MYAVGDEVLLSKDRNGFIRYVGEVPEMGAGLFYGVELTAGSIGQSDGSLRGKRYFTTDGKRALFAPSSKIRRKMTTKDYKKKDSLRLMQEQKADPSTNGQEKTDKVLEAVAASAEDSPPTQAQQTAVEPQSQESDEYEPDTQEDILDSKVAETKPESPANGVKHNRRPSRSSTLTKLSAGVSAAETYETLLTFVLRQSEDLREQLLDVYAHPQLNSVLINAYAELKNMEKDEQEKVWNALLTRWKRFI